MPYGWSPARNFHSGGIFMSKKKKNGVRKMTDRDYANYIMSLKDERPAKAIVPEEEEKEKK